jgi:RNA recognition motif-containing protein
MDQLPNKTFKLWHTHLRFQINLLFSPLAYYLSLSLSLFLRDASDAVRGRDNYDFYGYKLRVEFAKGRRNDRGGDRDRDDRRGGDRDRYDSRDDRRGGGRDDRDRRDDRRGGRDDRRERPRREFRPRNTAFRVLVTGLPSNASWQDLKDFVKKAVRPIFTDVEKNGDAATGIVGFENYEDVERCISKLDDTKFTSKESDTDCYVQVMEDKQHRGGSGGDKGGSPRRKSRSRSRSRSPVVRGRNNRSPSPRRDAPSRSRSPLAAADRRRGSASRSASPMQQEQGGNTPPRDGSRSPARSRSPSQDAEAPL